MGRPRKHNRKLLKEKFLAYINETPVPIVAEFAAQNGLCKQYFYEIEEFIDLVKACTTKKESALERQGLTGLCNVPMAIFSLKQLGWSDRQETTHTGAMSMNISPADAKL